MSKYESIDNYTFQKWLNSDDEEIGENIIVNDNIEITVVFTKNASEPEVPSETVTETIVFGEQNWTNSVKYSEFAIGKYITVSASTSGNNGKYYSSDSTWRIYQSDSGTFTITAPEGKTIISVNIKYKSSNNGYLIHGENEVKSESDYSVNSNSITFSAKTKTANKTNGQALIISISVTYSTTGSGEDSHEHELTAHGAKAATCTEAGNSAYWYCEVCEKYFSDENANADNEIEKDSWVISINKENHTGTVVNGGTADVHTKYSCCGTTVSAEHSYTSSVVTEPTCTTKGTTKYSCECGYSYTAQDVPEAEHDWETTLRYDNDNHWYKCENCEATKDTTAHNHSTTEKDGTHHWTKCACGHTTDKVAHSDAETDKDHNCDTCGQTVGDHSYDEGVVTTAPTCTKEGVKTFTCNCGHTYTEDVDINPANHVNTTAHEQTDATCTEVGYTAGTYCEDCKTWIDGHAEIEKIPHADGEDNNHDCDACGEKNIEGHTSGTAVEENRVDSTCTKEGSYNSVVYCTECGAELSRETKTIEKKAHTEETIPAVAPGCETTGLTAGTKCSVCGETLVAQTEVAAKGHAYGEVSYTWNGDYTECTATRACTVCKTHSETANAEIDSETTNATCTAEGKTTYTATFTAEWAEMQTKVVEIDKLPHTPGADATCTTAQTCTECGTELKAALGHTDVEPDDNKCDRCNTALCSENDHVWDNGTVTKAATCTEKGETTYTCTACEATKIGDINSLGHDYSTEWTTDVEPTCTTVGSKSHHCSRCDSKSDVTEIPAIAHNNKEHHEEVAATCVATGTIEYWYCPDCDKNFSNEACTTEVTDLTIAIDSTNHVNTTDHEQTDATCTEVGYTAGTYCEDCDKWISGHQEIPATGHAETKEYRVINDTLYLIPTCGCEDQKEAVEKGTTVAISNEADLKTVLGAGYSVKLGADIYLTSAIELTNGQEVTIDLNGHTITADWATTDPGNDEYVVVEVLYISGENTKVTIIGEGNMISGDPDTDYDDESNHYLINSVVSVLDKATLNIEGGYYCSYNIGDVIFAKSGSKVYISGGKFEAKNALGGMYFVLDTYDNGLEDENTGFFHVTGGTFVNFDPADHTNDGAYTNKVAEGYHSIYNEETKSYTVSAHDFSEEWSSDSNGHWYECECGEKSSEAGHSYDNDCDTDCNVCGNVRTITHNYTNEIVDAKYLKSAATCTSAAVYYKSCNCGAFVADENANTFEDGKALGHSENAEGDKAATCQTQAYCSRCESTYGSTDANNHVKDPETDTIVYNYTSNGDKTHKVTYACCDATYAESVTCVAGENSHNCKDCGQKISECSDVNTDTDHKCDVCGEDDVTEHTDGDDNNHLCDNGCGQVADDGCHDAENDGDHNCDECDAENVTNCSGGTATCIAKAVCEECDEEYGETNANNHANNNFEYTDITDSTHTKKHSCCKVIVAENATHEFGEWAPAENKQHAHSCECGKTEIEDCVAGENSHNCATCNATLSECADNNKDHSCDTCGNKTSDCTASDTACEVCGKKRGTLTFDDESKREIGSNTIWKESGITLTTSNTNDYLNPARFYANSSLSVSTEGTITNIVFNCNNASYANTLKNSIGDAATANEKVVTVTLDGTSNTFTVAKLTAQVRVDSIEVTYVPYPEYTVNFDTNGGSAIESQTVVQGNKVTEPPTDPTMDGFIFRGWYKDAECTEGNEWNFETDTVTANTIIYAKWEEVIVLDYDVVFKVDGETYETQTVTSPETATEPPTAPTKDGYIFRGWYLEGENEKYDFSTPVTSNITLEAKWICTIENALTLEDGAEVVVAGFVVVEGTNAKIFMDGYSIDVYDLGDAYTKHSYVIITGTISKVNGVNEIGEVLVCTSDENVKPTLHTVTFEKNNPNATNTNVKVIDGYIVDKINVTRTGYKFDGWYADAEFNTEYNFSTTVTSDITIYAKWIKLFTVTFSTDGGTSIASQKIEENGTATRPETDPTKSGYIFNGWNYAGTEYDFSTPVTADITLEAVWEKDPNSGSGGEDVTYVWEKVDLADIQSTDVIVIVWTTSSGTSYAMSNNNGTGSAPAAVEVTINGNQLSGEPADNIKWNISNSNGSLTIYPNGQTTTWLYCTSTNNGVRVGTNANKVFTIDSTSGYLKHTGTSRYLGVYTTTPDVRCYTTSTTTNIANQTLAFYRYTGGTSSGGNEGGESGSDEPSVAETTKYTFSSYTAGTQYAQGEEHELDNNTKLTINGAHLNSQVRLYSGSNAVFESVGTVNKITVKAGYKAGILTVYISNDGSTWTKVKAVTTNTSYIDYTVDLGGNYNYIKLESASAQIRVSELTINPTN